MQTPRWQGKFRRTPPPQSQPRGCRQGPPAWPTTSTSAIRMSIRRQPTLPARRSSAPGSGAGSRRATSSPGDEWSAAIIKAIDQCRAMVLIFSQNANNSRQIRREVERAITVGIPLIPVRIEDVVPTESLAYFMGTVHWLDAMTPPFEDHLVKLADSLKGLLQARAPSPSAQHRAVHGAGCRRARLRRSIGWHRGRHPILRGHGRTRRQAGHVRRDHEFQLPAIRPAGVRLVPDLSAGRDRHWRCLRLPGRHLYQGGRWRIQYRPDGGTVLRGPLQHSARHIAHLASQEGCPESPAGACRRVPLGRSRARSAALFRWPS